MDILFFVQMQKMKITCVGVELIELKSGDLRWCLDFRDMSSPAIMLLADAYGNKGGDHGGFVLCPSYGRKSKAFQAASGTTNAAIISNLVWTIVYDFILICICGASVSCVKFPFAP